MHIKVLGPGCNKCSLLEANLQQALSDLNITAQIEKVSDTDQIADYGVMLTPALVIDDEVKASGRILTTDEIKQLLTQ